MAKAHAADLASVIILNHNGAAIMDIIRRSVQATLAQDYPHIQLILVDDNSTDGSDRELASLAREVGAAFASTREDKHGVSAGRNAGLRLAEGEYLAFLDNDAVPLPGWLSALVRRMSADDTIGACASRVMFADKPDIINSMGSVLNELFHGNGVCMHEMFAFARWPEEVMYATGNGMMLRAEAVRQVGLFDEGYRFWGADDADYGMRLWRAGWRVVTVPDAVVSHLHSFSKLQKGMSFWDGRNRVRMALKHQSWRELPRFVLRDVIYFAKPAQFIDYVRTWWSIFADREGFQALVAYRRRHRGEPPYAAMFRRYLQRPDRLVLVGDNRQWGQGWPPLSHLHMGQGEEPHLYHGWFWTERWGDESMRWAMRAASLVGSLPSGARRLHWRLLSRRGAAITELTLCAQKWSEADYETVGKWTMAFGPGPGTGIAEVATPCELAPGDYRFILSSEETVLGDGFFPRRIGFGLVELRVETGQG